MTDQTPPTVEIGDVIRRGGNSEEVTITVTVDDEWAAWLASYGGWVKVEKKKTSDDR